jgi:hypothetical protein
MTPALALAFSIRVEVGAPVETGVIDGRLQRCVPILGGTFAGERLQGTVLPLGADWQAIATDGLTEVDARYALLTDDGTPIEVHNRGIRVATPEVSAMLARGEPVEPDAYYFRTHPRFTVAAGPHDWLRRTIFLGTGIRRPDHVLIHIHAVG